MTQEHSPYSAALGDRIDQLHPRLRSYFQAIPAGSIGVGIGMLDRLGCPRPLLRIAFAPLFLLLSRRGAVYRGWAEDVPFEVRNRGGDGRVCAERVFRVPGRTWTMSDAVQAQGTGIVDRLGRPAALAAAFEVQVEHGALALRSTRIGLRLGPIRLRTPRFLAGSIRLTESFDDTLDRQRIALTVDVPLIGRVYEYSGTFRYRIEEEAA